MKKLLLPAVSAIILMLILSCSQPPLPQGYALIYAVENYPSYNPLTYTVDDAEAVAELLDRKGWSVTIRTESSASLSSFESDIQSIKTEMSSEDRFIFYFSGHGFFIPSAAGEPESSADAYDETIVFYDTMITDDELGDYLSELSAVNKTVIIDACYSGGFIGDGFTFSTIEPDYTKDELSASFTPAKTLGMYMGFTPNDRDLPGSSYTVLAASGETEESYESGSVGHGIFTYFLLQTPDAADYNFDGYISLIEAWRYISINIDSFWNSSSYIGTAEQFMPNLSAFPVDPVLFEAD